MKMNEKKKAFTLAEVLIALTIIGVIAAITLPALIQRTNKQETVTALKKAYSTLSQAANQIIAENGSPKCTSSTSHDCWGDTVDTIYNEFKKHLNVLKDCGSGEGCFSKSGYEALTYHNVAHPDSTSTFRKIRLPDGISAGFALISNICNSREAYGSTDYCAMIWVDVNGDKGPSIVGRDMFRFYLTETGIVPAGCELTTSCRQWEGWGCACEVLREGAMNY